MDNGLVQDHLLIVKQKVSYKQQFILKLKIFYYSKHPFNNQYREGLESLFKSLKDTYQLIVLSGDNEGEKLF
jgi:Cu+-exporting ATPase